MFKKFTRLLLTVRQADRKVEGAMPLFIVHTVPLCMCKFLILLLQFETVTSYSDK